MSVELRELQARRDTERLADAEMIPTTEAARRLGIRPHTLRVWRLLGKGPAYVRYGSKSGRCYYTASDIAEYRAARTFSSTAAETARDA